MNCSARATFRLFKDGAPCPNDYLSTPNVCRPCALDALGAEIKSGNPLSWCRDYVHARAYLPKYHAHLCAALRRCRALIVSNEMTRARLRALHGNVRVLPGGVDLNAFPVLPQENRAAPRDHLHGGASRRSRERPPRSA